jgi:hypothetical protein
MPINCKIATFIRLPVVSKRKCFDINSSVTVKEHIVSNLFTYKYNDHETIFYVTDDIIGFTNHRVEKYRGMNLIPLFDYKSKIYDLLIINPQQYIGTPSIFVKAPNGNLYAVFSHYSIKTYNYNYIKYRLFTVNNLTKGKEIFRYEGENPGDWMRRDDQNLFPTFFYTKPLYNSFIIIMQIDTHNKLEKNCIYILDLLKDNVKEVSYDLKNYIKKHIDNFVYSLKENHEIVVEADNIFVNPRIVLNHFLTPYTPISAGEEIPDSDCKLIKYKNKIPVYNHCESTFLLQLESIISHRNMNQQKNEETKLSCSIVIQFSAYIDNNEVSILLACKKIQINVSTAVYNMPVDDILLYEKYTINDRYNISESRLYSIDAFFDDYVLKNRDIYHWDGNSYKLVYKLRNANINTLKRKGMCFITVNNQMILAIIQPKIVKEDQLCVKIGNNGIVDLSKIKEIIKAYKIQNKPLLIDVSKYIKTISIENLVDQIFKKAQNKRKKRRKKCKVKLYKSCTFEEAGILYIFILIHCILIKNKKTRDKTPYKRFAIVRYNIRGSHSSGKTIFLSRPYFLKYNMQSFLSNEIINKINNKTDKNIHFVDFLKHLLDASENANEVLYLYNQDLIVRHKVSIEGVRYYVGEGVKYHIASIMEFKDVKYNRKSQVRCEGLSNIPIESVKRITIRPSMNRYGNIAVHSFDVKIITNGVDKHFNYETVVIFSAINLIYATQIKVYN